MTLTAEPTTATTSSGAMLPLVALAPGELLTITEKNVPLITDSLSEGVHVKLLRMDLEAVCWVVLATFSPGRTTTSNDGPGERCFSSPLGATPPLAVFL